MASFLTERFKAKEESRQKKNLVRALAIHSDLIDFCSNDYLGFANHPDIIKASQEAIERYGAGSRASRLISGNFPLLEELENKLASFKGTESSLVYPSGYQTNLGLLASLIQAGDAVYVDRLAHSCLVDGVRLSPGKLRVFPHNDLEKLEALLKRSQDSPARWIIVDSVYSMDGDIAPLDRLLDFAYKYNAVIVVDDAHGTGVLGEKGSGVCEHFQISPRDHAENLIIVATFGKALGTQGGAVLGSKELVDFLINESRPFIYTTGISPGPVGGTLKALQILEGDRTHVQSLRRNIQAFLRIMRDSGLEIAQEITPIIPIILGSEEKALKASKELKAQGLLIPAIRPPTVPKNTSRIRVTLRADLSEDVISDCALKVAEVCNSLLSDKSGG